MIKTHAPSFAMPGIQLGARSILSAGTVLARNDERIDFFPFNQHPSYRVSFAVKFEAGRPGSGDTLISHAGEETTIFELRRPFQGANLSAFSSEVFASTSNDKFYFDYIYQTVGSTRSFIGILLFTFTHASVEP